MNRTLITPNYDTFPPQFHPLLQGAVLYDSSCSADARVYYIDRDEGFYLKASPRGTLETEAKLTCFLHERGLAAEVLAYEQADRDWLLTRRVPGEDCTHRQYLEDPHRLAELLGTRLRCLHALDPTGCPVTDHTKQYLDTVYRNYEARCFDNSGRYHPCSSAEEAIAVVREFAPYLRRDTLLHGDYCLPNVMLDDWRFSGFIDLGRGGVGDRHIDLFWGAWSLWFNLKTDAYSNRFLDAYGRDRVEPEILKAIGAFEVFG